MSRFFRQESPPLFDDHREYRPYLRRDFRQVCAYCERPEAYLGGEDFFQVDHFRPRSKFPHLETQYSNLYYVCGKCNQHKGKSWPSDSLLAKGFRFSDPCDEDMYLVHLRELDDAKIEALSNCGRYTSEHIRLNRPDIVYWRRQRRQFLVELPILEKLKTDVEAQFKVSKTGSDLDELRNKLAALEAVIALDRRRFSL